MQMSIACKSNFLPWSLSICDHMTPKFWNHQAVSFFPVAMTSSLKSRGSNWFFFFAVCHARVWSWEIENFQICVVIWFNTANYVDLICSESWNDWSLFSETGFFGSEFAVTNCRICGTGSITGCYPSTNVSLDHVRVTVNGQWISKETAMHPMSGITPSLPILQLQKMSRLAGSATTSCRWVEFAVYVVFCWYIIIIGDLILRFVRYSSEVRAP